MSLKGQVALITGGVKNLGALTAHELAAQGANLALHYHSANSQSAASSLSAELKQKYPSIKVATFQGDLKRASAVTKLFQDTLKEFGKIDIVVNTVGKVLKKPITEISEEEYDEMFEYVSLFPPPANMVCFDMMLTTHLSVSTPRLLSSSSRKPPPMFRMEARSSLS